MLTIRFALEEEARLVCVPSEIQPVVVGYVTFQ